MPRYEIWSQADISDIILSFKITAPARMLSLRLDLDLDLVVHGLVSITGWT